MAGFSVESKPGKTGIETGLNLLLVDKDDITLLKHRRIAEDSGLFHSIRSAVHGLHAFDLISSADRRGSFVPDVVILDLDLPILNGITLLKILREADLHKQGMIYVVAAALVSPAEHEALRALGVSHILLKPLSQKTLGSVLRKINREKYKSEVAQAEMPSSNAENRHP